jgi:hypothetical protein
MESVLYLEVINVANPHWARVVSYCPFSLCVIHKEGLCPSSGDIDWLMMMIDVENEMEEFDSVVQADADCTATNILSYTLWALYRSYFNGLALISNCKCIA